MPLCGVFHPQHVRQQLAESATLKCGRLGVFATGATDYTYSQDGSLTSDANKGIANIEYNYLKRPKKYTFSNGSTLENQYDATGKKLKSISSDGVTYDFLGNIILKNNVLYQISHDEGRIIDGQYEYEIKDYLGNLRVAFRDSLGIAKITQKQDYDIHGSELQGLSYTKPLWNQDNFKYLGRESIAQTGYIDLLNRQYDRILGRFTSPDPVIEGQEDQSLYQYGWNNPVLRSDPNGNCPTCPPYTNPMQPVWEGFGQMFQAGASLIDRISIATTSLVEKTFTLGGTSTTTSNLTSTDTHTNFSASFSYIKNNNSNEGNTTPFFSTTIKNETSASTKKEVDLGVGKASIKNSVTTDGKVTVETKADVRASKLWTVGATTSVNTNGDSKFKVEGTTGVSKGKAGVFTQFTNSLKSNAAEIGISFETESKNNNVKTKNTASIKYTQNKP